MGQVAGETSVRELVQKISAVSSDSKLSKAISLIPASPARAVAVIEGKHVVGVLDGRCLLDFHENAETTNCGSVAGRVPIISNETTAEEVVMHFLNSNARALPFVDRKGALEGAVSRSSVLKLIEHSGGVRQARVADFASQPGAWVPEETTVQQARRKMKELGTFHLAVVDGAGKLSGVVTCFDIVEKIVPHEKKGFKQSAFAATPEVGPEEEPVKSIMHEKVFTTTPQAPLSQAVSQMVSNNVACLVVVEETAAAKGGAGAGGGSTGLKPVGLLSAKDALHAVLKPAPEPVLVYGLREDEKPLAESIQALGAEFLEKLDKKMRVDYLAIHVKSFLEGKKRRYAVKGKLCVRGRLLTATTPERSEHKAVWDLHLSVKEVLGELSRIAAEAHDKPLEKKVHRPRVEE